MNINMETIIFPDKPGQVVRAVNGNIGIVTTKYATESSMGVMFVGSPYAVKMRTAELEVITITGTRAATHEEATWGF